MNEKKRKILIAAMKLFSKTSFHQTSMQQIADVCGVSKGSLYTHFKSKEELLSEIFSYYYHVLSQQMAAEETKVDSAKEAFIREIAIRLRHYCEFHEFFKMQMNEVRGLEDPSLNQFVHQEHTKLLQKTEKGIVLVFGQEVAPYATDLTATLKGMLITYVRGIIEHGKKCDLNELARFLFLQLDAIVHTFIDKKPNPFFITSPLQLQPKETTHPLYIVRKMKEAIASFTEDILIESVDILEKELLEIKPRAAVLSGMIHNLKASSTLFELATELEKTINQMPITTLNK
ncbi:TetR/AcrR family transcriptional regulator [Bacillus cihuensis]|uniref:TetR/AcrR family transcriptional regulator n=1 Tax=Bacillus cihuensis TaxID=1208599 RepID=UPI0004281AFE|nr:TetR/AcrR family transcriptional regulator [Bacillus cihuensis]